MTEVAESESGSRSRSARPPRRSLREEQKQMTRQKLLDAARDMFEEKGYAATTIDDIVYAAGASRGTYYLYYKNKGEIVRELARSYASEAEELLAELTEVTDPTPADLRTWIESYVAQVVKHRSTIRAWIQAESAERELRSASDENMNRYLGSLTDWLMNVRAAHGRKESRQVVRTRAILLLLQIERFCYFWLIRGWKVDKRSAIDTLAELWHNAVYGENP